MPGTYTGGYAWYILARSMTEAALAEQAKRPLYVLLGGKQSIMNRFNILISAIL